jgi:PilZ domain
MLLAAVTFGSEEAFLPADLEVSGLLTAVPPERVDTRVEVALPLRVTFWDCENKPLLDMACTYDISSRGARISGLRAVVEAGDIVAIERGKNKTFCRVIWVGDSGSRQRGQVGLQSVEADRQMWDSELREMNTVFDLLPFDKKPAEKNSALRFREENRRKHSRFKIEGIAEVNSPASKTPQLTAALKDLSELGCLISIQNAPPLGSDLTLVLKIDNYEFNLTGQVRHVDTGDGTGIQFHRIRKGDRQMLQHLLRKLAEQQLERSFEIVLQR